MNDGVAHTRLVDLTISFFNSEPSVQDKLEEKMREPAKVYT